MIMDNYFNVALEFTKEICILLIIGVLLFLFVYGCYFFVGFIDFIINKNKRRKK